MNAVRHLLIYVLGSYFRWLMTISSITHKICARRHSWRRFEISTSMAYKAWSAAMWKEFFLKCSLTSVLFVSGFIVEVVECAEQEIFDDPDTGEESIGGTEVVFFPC